jgi:SulP family sulfate permease
MLVGFAEGLGAARTWAARHHYEIDPNRELLGLGAANLGSGIAGGMVVNGSPSKTAVNGSAGAKTQLSGLVVGALTVVTLLFLTGLFENLPEATLAAVVIVAVMELVDTSSLRRLYRLGAKPEHCRSALAMRPDFIAASAALVGVLVFATLPGLFIGIAVSLLLLLYRTAVPPIAVLGKVRGTTDQYGDVARHPENEGVAGLVILGVAGGLFFANAEALHKRLCTEAARDGIREIVLDAETMPFIDVTAAQMLGEVADELSRRGVRLVLAHGIGDVRQLVREAEAATIHVCPTVRAAVDAYEA